MKILITGSAGFIGYHLSKSLLKDGYEIYGIDNINNYYDRNLKISRLEDLKSHNNFSFTNVDIANKVQMSNIFKSFKPQKVINLAAQVGVRNSIKDPYSYIDSNLNGYLNIIELCRNHNVEGYIYASSSSVYGINDELPFKEESHNGNSPITLYGATKRANELIAYSYSHLYSLNTTGLRFFTVYGPWNRPDMAMFIFTKKIILNEPIDVYNNGQMKRDFTFIDDIISGIRSAIDKNYKFELFNLGNNRSESLVDMISLLEEELKLKAIIKYRPHQPGDLIETSADISHSKDKLSYNPKTSLSIGIPKFINWYKKYYNI